MIEEITNQLSMDAHNDGYRLWYSRDKNGEKTTLWCKGEYVYHWYHSPSLGEVDDAIATHRKTESK
jgi:hypothetical protein